MRTTLEIADEVLRRAKIVAVERGTTLRELVTLALVRELAQGGEAPFRRRSRFPVFTSTAAGSLDLDREDLARFEVDEDVRRHGLAS